MFFSSKQTNCQFSLPHFRQQRPLQDFGTGFASPEMSVNKTAEMK